MVVTVRGDIVLKETRHDIDEEIKLLDEMLLAAYQKDPDMQDIIDHSQKINNDELIETLRELLLNNDFEDVKKMIMGLSEKN